MKINFKVGDRVKCINVVDNNKKVLNALGTITEIRTNICVEFDEVIAESWVNRSWIGKHGHKWICEEKDLKLISNETIVIYRKDNETIALDKLTGKKAVAKCSPQDKFDFYTGAKLALDRLTSNVTFRVLAIKGWSTFLTRGKIYEFVDGKTTWDNGKISSEYDNYTHLIKHNRQWEDGVLIELKDGDNPEEILKKYDTIKEGDTVKVINYGETYTTHIDWLERNITNKTQRYKWDYNKTPSNGDTGRVIAIEKYNYHSNLRLGYVEINGRCYIIGVEGLEKC